MEDQLDLLAGFLLECGDDLPDWIVFLGVVALIPPDDEIGAPGAERRHQERRSEKASSAPHRGLPKGGAMHLNVYSLRICLMRTIASSTACSGLMPSAATRWTAFAQIRSFQTWSWRRSPETVV